MGNAVEQEIVLSRAEAQANPSVIGKVAALTGQTPATVDKALTNEQYSPYQPVPVLSNAPMATVQFLEEHQGSYPGVSVEQVAQRSYPQGGATGAQLLGYVGDITAQELSEHPNQGYIQSSLIGKSGLEAEYEQVLRGTAGEQSLEVNRTGTVVGSLHHTNPTQGDTLVTNIDLGLQQALENSLASQIAIDRKTPDVQDGGRLPPAINGAAVALDPQTGAVLTLASYPTYNLNEWIGGISTANYGAISVAGAENNYAIQGLFTPGSTFKLITATAALEDQIISPGTFVDDTGTFRIPNCTGGSCTFHNNDSEALGEVNLVSASTQSDDYYFYNLGELFWNQRARFGETAIQNVGAAYGLESPTGIDLPNESTGRIDSPLVRKQLHTEDPKAFPYDTWYTGDNVEMAFGQGGTVLTPIALADAYATFANGGTHYVPQIVSAVVSPSGKVVENFPARVSHNAKGQPDTVSLPASVSGPILQGLEGVISNPKGTGYAAFQGFPLSRFLLAGKTGTASPNAPGQEPNSWFVAFGPIPNPQYVILVVIGQGGYGASAAAPVVRAGFNYLEANPISPVVLPGPTHEPTTTPEVGNPPFGTPTTTTTTSTTTTTAPGHGVATTTTTTKG